MRTSARIAAVESKVRAAFTVADAKANLAINPIPPAGHSPASKIAAAIRTDAIQGAAGDAVQRIKSGLADAVKHAELEIEAIAHEAAAALVLASFVTGKAPELPDNIPDHLKSAALAMRGQPGASIVAKQLEFAAQNAEAEVDRLRAKYLPRTKLAATVAGHRKAKQIFESAGLMRRAQAAHLMAERASDRMQKAALAAGSRRIGS